MKKSVLRNRIAKAIQKKHKVDTETLLEINNIINDYLVLDKKYKNIPKVCACGRMHSQKEIDANKCANCRGLLKVELKITKD